MTLWFFEDGCTISFPELIEWMMRLAFGVKLDNLCERVIRRDAAGANLSSMDYLYNVR